LGKISLAIHRLCIGIGEILEGEIIITHRKLAIRLMIYPGKKQAQSNAWENLTKRAMFFMTDPPFVQLYG
jgi:hypothetical protein